MSGGHDDEPHEEHEEHVNHEAWVIPYADLLTLLMAMFIALFAMSSVDQAKFKKVALGLNQALGGDKLDTGVFADGRGAESITGGNGATGTGAGGGVGPDKSNPGKDYFKRIADQQSNLDTVRSAERVKFGDVQKEIEKAADKLGLKDKLTFELQERGLVVRVITDDVLFSSGDATLQSQGAEVLKLVGKVLASLDNTVLIEGHTDNRPIRTDRFRNNWDLSAARANSVLMFLADEMKFDVQRLRPTAWADLHPLADNATPEGQAKNRRVEIVVESKIIDQLLEQNHVTDKAVDSREAEAKSADPRLDEIAPDLKPAH